MNKYAKLLRAIDVMPKCPDHKPRRKMVDGMWLITCKNCGFSAVSHPDYFRKNKSK